MIRGQFHFSCYPSLPRRSQAEAVSLVGAIDPFDFAQGRLSIASGGSGLPDRSQAKAGEPPLPRNTRDADAVCESQVE